ncbi:MAG: CHAD domain-containing protein [Planctomycetes bacterium]|nr:CHAD domain-containing protein [Planctomycetota bacterium]
MTTRGNFDADATERPSERPAWLFSAREHAHSQHSRRVAPLRDEPAAGDSSTPSGQAALALLQAHAAAFLHHVPEARAGAASAAALLEMREAGRRLRTALDVFAGLLPEELRGLAADLERLNAPLGGLRALGTQMEVLVRLERDRAPLCVSPQDSAELAGLFREELLAARARLQAALAAPRCAALEEVLRRLLSGAFEPDCTRDGEPISRAAARLLKERFRAYRDLGDELSDDSPAADYHVLRTQSEAFCHALELFEHLFGRPARELLAKVARVDDLLCIHQDACFAISHLRSLASGRAASLSAATAFALGALAERHHRRSEDARRRFARAFLRTTGKRWRRLCAALGPG